MIVFYPYRYRDGLHWKRKVFYVLEFARSHSNKIFTNNNADLDMAQKIQTGRLFVQLKEFGRPKASKETVECVLKKFLQSPNKSLRSTSLEIQIPPTSVWRILRKSMIMKPYKLQLVQAITADDKRKCKPD